MNIVSIFEAKPGMMLDEAVHNQKGVLLLPAGSHLTEKNIKLLQSRGIDEIRVKGPRKKNKPRKEEADRASQGATDIASIEREVREKFSDVLENPVMVNIMEAAVKQIALRQTGKDN